MIVNPNAGQVTPLTPKPVTPQQPKPVAPVEPKERFVSSEMAQMLDNMERAGVLPVKSEVTPAPEPQRREPQGEMAQMLENIQRAEETFAAANLSGLQAKAAPGQNAAVPTSLVMLEEPAHHEDHGHGHPPVHNKEMAGHIGLKFGEKALHGAEAKLAHGASEAASAKATHATSEAVSAKAAHAGGEAAAAKATHGASELASNAADIGATLAIAAGVGAAASGALGVVMLHSGLKEIKEGLKHKDTEHTLEGIGSTVVGVRSGAAAVTLAGMAAHGSEVLTTLASGAQVLLAPLGVLHGAIDITVGSKQLYEGVKEGDNDKKIKGGLNVGMGLALGGAALGGGIPALVVAGVILGGKIVHGIAQKRAAAAEQQAQPQENVSKAS